MDVACLANMFVDTTEPAGSANYDLHKEGKIVLTTILTVLKFFCEKFISLCLQLSFYIRSSYKILRIGWYTA